MAHTAISKTARSNKLAAAFSEACAARGLTPSQAFGQATRGEKAALYQALSAGRADVTIDIGLRILSILALVRLRPERLDNGLARGLAALKRITESGAISALPDCSHDELRRFLQAAGLGDSQSAKVAASGPTMASHAAAWEKAVKKFGSKRKLVPLEIKPATPQGANKRFTDFTDAHRKLFGATGTTMMGWSKTNGFNWVSVRGLLAGEFSGETGLSHAIVTRLYDDFGKKAVDEVIAVARATGADSGRRFKGKADERRRHDLQHKLDINGISQTEFAEMHGVKHATVTSIINGRHSGKRGEARRIVELLEALPDTPQRPSNPVDAMFYDRGTTLADWAKRHNIDPVVAREAASLVPMGRKSWQQLRCRMLLSKEFGLPDTTHGESASIAGLLALHQLSMANMAEAIGVSRQAIDYLIRGKITLNSKLGEDSIAYVCRVCKESRSRVIAVMEQTGARFH